MANLYLDFESDDEYHRYLEQTDPENDESVDENDNEWIPECPRCGGGLIPDGDIIICDNYCGYRED